jgi:hypothetical protein
MSDADTNLGIVVLGGGVAAAAWCASTGGRVLTPNAVPDPSSALWVHPVPSLGERRAVVSNPFRDAEGKVQHLGADVMYRRNDTRDLLAVFPVGSAGGTTLFFMPEHIPAFAACAGVVTFASRTGVGNTVIVRHANGWATYYTHLATLAVRRGEAVSAGQTLGTIGASPADAAHLRHLHFELWRGAVRSGAADPNPFLQAWSRVRIAWSPNNASVASQLLPRNASLTAYRPVGDRGESYPEWVRRLRGASGVYVIREIGGAIVYVGSSVGRLYETLTRHFQTWRRYKGFWRGQFAEGADPGLTYPRKSVEVAIKITSPDDAHEEEMRTIRRLQPRDNQIGQPEPEFEAVPF